MAKKEEKKEKNTKKVEKRKNNKTKKEGFIKGVKKELKVVIWPTVKEMIKYTGATIILCIILIAFFQVLDFVLAYIKGMFV